jgi:hypothetical protein
LQSAAYIPELCAEVENALDSIYKAEIPLSMHVKDIIVRKMKHTPHGPQMLPKTSKVYPAMKHAPSIVKSKQQWRQFFWDNVLKTGIHEHTFTCKKPPQGFHHCRTGKPSGSSQKTQPVFLEVEGGINRDNLQDKVLTQIMPTPQLSPPPLLYKNLDAKNQRDFMKVPILSPPDDELLVWELKRPLLEPLPMIPDTLYLAFKQHLQMQSAMNHPQGDRCSQAPSIPQASPDHDGEHDGAEILRKTKEFCISQIASCLHNTGDDSDETMASITAWLGSYDAVSVVKLYKNLNTQLKTRNGYVVETNPTLSIATGASTNTLFF